MPLIIKNGQVLQDNWRTVAKDETALPANPSQEDRFVLPLALWLKERDSVIDDPRFGLWLDSEECTSSLSDDDLKSLPLIAVNFPKFTDGRGYSHARILREHRGFAGELRAIGDVLHDQLFFMQRCGFNAFQVNPEKDIAQALTGFSTFTNPYQAAADTDKPLFRRLQTA